MSRLSQSLFLAALGVLGTALLPADMASAHEPGSHLDEATMRAAAAYRLQLGFATDEVAIARAYAEEEALSLVGVLGTPLTVTERAELAVRDDLVAANP